MNIQTPILAGLLLTLAAGCDPQGAAWEEAREADTIAAYREFLEDYPDSPRAEEAEQRVRALRREELWQQTRDLATIEAYEDFLAEFSEGEEAQQARQRLGELERQREWERLRGSTDLAAMRAFADQHQGHPLAEQARQRAAQLEEAAREREQARLEAERERRRVEEEARSHRVQLAALRTTEQAREGIEILEARLNELLGETSLETEQSGGFYLIRTEPLAEEDARALCERLKERNEDCLVVPR